MTRSASLQRVSGSHQSLRKHQLWDRPGGRGDVGTEQGRSCKSNVLSLTSHHPGDARLPSHFPEFLAGRKRAQHSMEQV